MPSPIQKINGLAEWTQEPGDVYLCTGITTDGRRFRRTGDWNLIRAINVYRGTKWLVRAGRRYKLQECWN